jgi:hypothetical protein
MSNKIEVHHVIVNGKPDESTIKDYTDNGWIAVGIDRADKFHPYALNSDSIVFFAKPINKEYYDSKMKAFAEAHECEVSE